MNFERFQKGIKRVRKYYNTKNALCQLHEKRKTGKTVVFLKIYSFFDTGKFSRLRFEGFFEGIYYGKGIKNAEEEYDQGRAKANDRCQNGKQSVF